MFPSFRFSPTFTIHQPKPGLFGLQEPSVDRNLHVQSHLGVHQCLVLPLLPPQLLEQLLFLNIFGSQLTISEFNSIIK